MLTTTLNSLRRAKAAALAAAGIAMIGLSNSAEAAVFISSGATSGITCTGGVCTPTQSAAVLNVSQLQTLLASGNVSVTTGGSLASNIVVNAELTWVSASTLSLDAYQSITINKPMPNTGTGGLTVLTDDGGSGGTFLFGAKGSVSFWSLSSPLTINGNAYTLVPNISTLASDIAANASGFYALTADYNAKPDGDYLHSPIATTFSGSFEGLGHTISDLSIIDKSGDSYVGLFALLGIGSVIENIDLAKARVYGVEKNYSITSVGALAGANDGSIQNATVSGEVWGTAGDIGGLVGWNGFEQNGSVGVIRNSSASAKVTGGLQSAVGGLVGYNGWNGQAGLVDNCYSTGSVVGTGPVLGGLVGSNSYGTIDFSHATGAVQRTTGPNSPNFASIGGLAGINNIFYINESWASGSVTGVAGDYVGGLVGNNSGTISQSYATGAASGGNSALVGGLVGLSAYGENDNSNNILNSYATGNASGDQSSLVGGLVGSIGCASCRILSNMKVAYSTGQVTGGSGSLIGGLVGEEFGRDQVGNDDWDTTTSGITSLSQGAGSPSNAHGINGLTNSQMQGSLSGFSKTIWGRRSTINGGLPYLLAIPPS
jgi:hypothetical protein